MKSTLRPKKTKHSRRIARPASRGNGRRDQWIANAELQQTRAELQSRVEQSAQDLIQESAAHYAELYDEAPVGYASINELGLILEMNLVGARLLGEARDHLLHQPFMRFVVQQDIPIFLQHLHRCKSASGPVVSELRLGRKGHAALPVQLVSVSARVPADREYYYRTVLIDGTAGARSPRGSEETDLHSLVASLNGIVWEAMAWPMRFIFISQAVERLLGFAADSSIRQPEFWQERLHRDDRERVLNECLRALNKGKDFALEYRMVAADGRAIWFRDTVAVSKLESGRFRLRGVMIENGGRKETDAALRRQIEELENRLQVRATREPNRPGAGRSGFNGLARD
jgi:PAS domain-containing protein